MKTSRPLLILTLMLSWVLVGCGQKAFTKGEYVDTKEINLLTDSFNENDMQLMAKKMVNSLKESPMIAALNERPVIAVGKVTNSTSEHINMLLLTDKIQNELINTNRFRFIDKAARDQLAEEYEYNKTGKVNPESAAKANQSGVKYLITGNLGSKVQTVGNDKLVFYQLNLRITDVSTNEIVWSEEKELRKKFEKQAVGL